MPTARRTSGTGKSKSLRIKGQFRHKPSRVIPFYRKEKKIASIFQGEGI
jgi:hypothetical protein